jgi:hypothetical protein
MILSLEWTDWHLTPNGWTKGSHKMDFHNIHFKEPPPDRLLTRRYEESIESIYAPLKIKRKTLWANCNPKLIKKLIRQYNFPNTLN